MYSAIDVKLASEKTMVNSRFIFGKRVLDVIVAVLLLVLLLPFILLVTLSVWLADKGPVIFTQQRVGKDGRRFRIYKFRTMVPRLAEDIDQHAERALTDSSDERITRVGRFLRITSIDEIPQLYNILLGEMSFIGPRPIIPEQLECIPPGCMKRFWVRPGLTGLAQVRGRRSLGWLHQLSYDRDYVENIGFLNDLAILMKTVMVVFSGRGVYSGSAQNWRQYRDSLHGRLPSDEDVLKEGE